MNKKTIDILSSYIDALRPIIYINHFDFYVIDNVISQLNQNVNCLEFNQALGLLNFRNKSPLLECDLENFLKATMDDGFDKNTFLVLKDVHNDLDNPKIIALLKRIAENNLYNQNYHCTVFILSDVLKISRELENFITIFDIPLPNDSEILNIINDFANDLKISISEEIKNEFAILLKGLNEFQIKQILNLAYQNGGNINEDDKILILKEKEQFVKKLAMLEIVNFKETINDIGGLENLKIWLSQKAKIFAQLDKAIKFGVDIPKGIMIIGMPGCGKSLTAKATASLFKIPLVRLDVGRLLGKYVGESENNMRKALQLAEAISPCVLWVDEIEKAFAGISNNNGGHEVTIRLFEQFLTWMQEKHNTVFIVATANDISNMHPEFLRKGRFDELFFVDLPNEEERRNILEIHLKKRKKFNRNIDTISLIKPTAGYNGADLESVVKESIEKAFITNKEQLETSDLLNAIQNINSISNTLGDTIKNIKEAMNKLNIKPASKSNK